jgi:hypothetical protein
VANLQKISEPLWVRLASMGLSGFYEQLVLEGDHLLKVETRGFSEVYDRLAYKDITALLVSRDRRWLYWSLVPVVECFVAGLMAFYTIQTNAYIPLEIFWLWIGLALIKLLFNLAAGPTCTVIVQTAVQQIPLNGLHRWRGIQNKLAPLRNKITETQGRLDETARMKAAAKALRSPMAQNQDRGLFHLIAGFCQCGAALTILLYASFSSSWLFFALFLFHASAGLCALIAVRKQQGQPIFGLLSFTSWASVAWWFLLIAVFIASVIFVAFVDDTLVQTLSLKPYVHYFQVDLRNYPAVYNSYLIVMLTGFALFLTTTFGYFEYRNRYQRGLHE